MGAAAEGEEVRRVGAAPARPARAAARARDRGARAAAIVARRAQCQRPEDPRARDRHHLRRLPRRAAARDRRTKPIATLRGNGRQMRRVDVGPATASTSPRSRTCWCWCWCSTPARRCSRGCRATSSTSSCSARCKRLRADVEAKLMRVPLAYFDGQPHGEILSRVTNDIDNVAMGLQQTLSQILAALLTVIGVLVMLVVISPLLALIALVTVPLSVVDHREDRQARAEGLRRAVEARRRAQRSDRGGVHRPRAGQGVRPARAGRGAVPREERRAVRRRASARSSSRA